MLNRKIAINRITAFVKSCYKNNKITFQKVILFGSIVDGKVHKYSDIDVAFVSDKFTGNPIEDWKMLIPIMTSNRKFIDIEPHPYSTEDFENGDPFIDVIKRTGIEIKI